MGVGHAAGKDKAEEAARMAISSPLLESSITGARGILMNIVASRDIGLEDAYVASEIIRNEAHPDANVKGGVNLDKKDDGKAVEDDSVWDTIINNPTRRRR